MVYLFVAQHEVEPNDVERFVLNFPGDSSRAAGYVLQHWPGKTFMCVPLPMQDQRPMVLCQQQKALNEKDVERIESIDAVEPKPEEGEVLFSEDLDSKDGVFD